MKAKLERQYASACFIRFLAEGRRVINVDETVLRVTDHRKRGWLPKGCKNLVSDVERLSNVNLFAGLSS